MGRLPKWLAADSPGQATVDLLIPSRVLGAVKRQLRPAKCEFAGSLIVALRRMSLPVALGGNVLLHMEVQIFGLSVFERVQIVGALDEQ